MSKIALPIAELKPALTGLSKVLDRRSTLPVLNMIKIERTRDGWVALTATDIESFVTVRLEQPSHGELCVILIPYEDLHSVMKSCNKDDCIFVRSEKVGSAASGIIEYPLSGQILERRYTSIPVDEFPVIPKIKGEAVSLPDNVRISIREAMDCASEEETRLILNSAYLDVSQPKCHHVVGTNGRHLYASNSFHLPLKEGVIIPTHRFLTYKEFNNDGEWRIKSGSDGNDSGSDSLVQISSRRWRFITRQHEGNFPNWRQVIPSTDQYKASVTFNPSDLDKLVQVIQRLPDHDTVNHAIGIEIKGQGIQLLRKSGGDEPMATVPISAAKIEGSDVRVHLNRQYLVKALRFGLNRLEVIDPMSPVRLSHEGRQMIVVPLRQDGPRISPDQTANIPSEASGNGEAETGDSRPVTTSEERKEPVANETSSPANSTPSIEGQLDQCISEIDTLRESLQGNLSGLTSLRSKLKLVQREYKGSVKEMQSVRQTLRSLQSVKL